MGTAQVSSRGPERYLLLCHRVRSTSGRVMEFLITSLVQAWRLPPAAPESSQGRQETQRTGRTRTQCTSISGERLNRSGSPERVPWRPATLARASHHDTRAQAGVTQRPETRRAVASTEGSARGRGVISHARMVSERSGDVLRLGARHWFRAATPTGELSAESMWCAGWLSMDRRWVSADASGEGR